MPTLYRFGYQLIVVTVYDHVPKFPRQINACSKPFRRLSSPHFSHAITKCHSNGLHSSNNIWGMPGEKYQSQRRVFASRMPIALRLVIILMMTDRKRVRRRKQPTIKRRKESRVSAMIRASTEPVMRGHSRFCGGQ